jgi:type II secretory pathway component PulF
MSDDINLKWAKLTFFKSTRIRVYRQVRAMVANQIPIKDALEAIYDNASNGGKKKTHPLALLTRLWIGRVLNGQSFSQAIRDCVPSDEQMLIEAGEHGNTFTKSLNDVVDMLMKKGKIKGAVIGGLAYPGVLVGVLLFMLYLFGTMVIPPFAMALPVEKWTGVAASLAALSSVVRWATIPIVLGVLGAGGFYFFTLPRWNGRSRVFFDRYPPWSMYRMFVGAGFMLSLAALIRAEVPVQKALPKLYDGGTPYLKTRVKATLRLVTNGIGIGDALHQTGYEFPDRQIVADLRIYSKMPSFSEMLNTISKEWIDQTVEQISGQAKALNAVVLVVITMFIIWMSYGLYDITNQISSAAMMGM